MPDLLFITTNSLKVAVATEVCSTFGITVNVKSLEMIEIQAENGETVAKDKANQAFAVHNKPLVISDDIWLIPGLNGFPGPYMKSVNGWLTPDDFLRLTLPLEDRRIILRQILVYQDDQQQKVFSRDITGLLLPESRGKSPYSHLSITSFDDGQHSAAERNNQGYSSIAEKKTAWHDLCTWLQTND